MEENEIPSGAISPANASEPAPQPPAGEPVQPLETFQSDIEKVLERSGLSAQDIQAAEALRDKKNGALARPSALPPVPVPIDPRSVVLPSKEVHSPLNASRTGADALVKQEREATLPKTPAPPLPIPQKPKNAIPPLETFQSDVQSYVRDTKVSAVTLIAAEERRRALSAAPISVGKKRSFAGRAALVAGGVVLIVAAVGGLGYAYLTHAPLPEAANPVAPFIAVDETTAIPFSPGDTRGALMQTLVDAKNSVALSLGLVAQLAPTADTQTPVIAQNFFSVLTPNMPAELSRTLEPDFLLGVHSFDVNQPFIILSVDSYEQGYAGMLAWETTLPQDLSPLFSYNPVSTTTAPQAPAAPQVLSTSFVDTIVENHDARAVENASGAITLLWTFLDRNTILIATNPDTVNEIISRLKAPPTITIPQ